jgi:hypothetical protein
MMTAKKLVKVPLSDFLMSYVCNGKGFTHSLHYDDSMK